MEDDHYIANPRNTHIDTSVFEADIRKRLAVNISGDDEALDSIYNFAFSRTNIAPPEPAEGQLVCRYLSPEKFLQFLHTRCINFPMATQFSDPWECRVPEDYENVVLRVLNDMGISENDWSKLVQRKAASWNVSCWTRLDDYFDDHLMWNSYAGGSQGVGITVRYGVLKDSFTRSVAQLDMDGILRSGNVNYKTLSLLPFNKHHIFRYEKEVRFAFRAFQPGAHSVSVDDIFDYFGVRISPAAAHEHYDMIRHLWLRYGGSDRVQWPQ